MMMMCEHASVTHYAVFVLLFKTVNCRPQSLADTVSVAVVPVLNAVYWLHRAKYPELGTE